jgi:hypothetical protein
MQPRAILRNGRHLCRPSHVPANPLRGPAASSAWRERDALQQVAGRPVVSLGNSGQKLKAHLREAGDQRSHRLDDDGSLDAALSGVFCEVELDELLSRRAAPPALSGCRYAP